MVYHGIIKGRTIELEGDLPFDDGQRVAISVESMDGGDHGPGHPLRIRQALAQSLPANADDVSEMLRHIQASRQLSSGPGVFDDHR